MAQVLGLPRHEVAELLRKGDTDFIFRAELPGDFSEAVSRLKELTQIHPAAPFYAGLLAGVSPENPLKPIFALPRILPL